MSVVAPEDHEVERTDWRERRRIELEERVAAFQRQIQNGELIVRLATPDERVKYGIDEHQERLARERQEAEANQRRVDDERKEAARLSAKKRREEAAARRRADAAARKQAPADMPAEMVARLRAAAAAGQDARRAVLGVLVGVADACLLTPTEMAAIVGLSRQGVQDRIERARDMGITGAKITDAEAQLRQARERELRAPSELDAVMADAADHGASWTQIGREVALTGDQVHRRVRALRAETDR